MKVLLVNGPNLNLLGTRETDIYGSKSLKSIVQSLHKKFSQKKVKLLDFQSNSEGALVDFLQQNKDADFALINPAAYGHTSVALADALKATQIPFVEIHISNVYARENFRHTSYLSAMAQGVIVGCGVQGYFLAADLIFSKIFPCPKSRTIKNSHYWSRSFRLVFGFLVSRKIIFLKNKFPSLKQVLIAVVYRYKLGKRLFRRTCCPIFYQ